MAVAKFPVTIETLVERARAIGPELQAAAAEADELRRLPDRSVAALRDAGLFRVFQPARFGGFELEYGLTQIELANAIGPASGSAAWVQSVIACHAWVVGMYPKAAQDAVWSEDPNVLVASAFGPSTGRGKPVDGGYWLEGEWEFSSGVHACDWIILNAPILSGEGRPPRLLFCLLPREDYDILDTWRSTGLRATGSHHVSVKGAFIPTEFTLDTGLAEGQRAPGAAVNNSYLYRLPLWTAFPFNIAAPAIGIARGAIAAWVEATKARPERAGMPTRQMRLAESCAEVDAAEALLKTDAAALRNNTAAGEPISGELRARCGRDLSYAAQLCMRAVDRLMGAVGAHGLRDDSAIARARADVYAIVNHVGLTWEGSAARYGATLLGVESTPGGIAKP